jgi:hypothetical protein
MAPGYGNPQIPQSSSLSSSWSSNPTLSRRRGARTSPERLRVAQNATPRALAIRHDPAQSCSECLKVAQNSSKCHPSRFGDPARSGSMLLRMLQSGSHFAYPPREPLWSGQTAGGAPRSGRTPTPPPFAHRMLLPPTAASGNGRRRALVRRFGGPPDEASRAAPHERGCWESPCGRPGLLTVLYHILLRLSSALLYFYSRHMTPHCLHL